MVFRDHVIRKRARSGKSVVWITDNELDAIWDDFSRMLLKLIRKIWQLRC